VTVSEYVTVHDTDDAFVGDTPVRLIDMTVGGVRSATQVNDADELAFPPDSACTSNVCDPLAVTDTGFDPEVVPGQAANAFASNRHWNVTPACES
jgi:hypothetical protein